MKSNTTTHNPEWWLTEEILPPNPWAYIVADFQWADEIIEKLKTHPFVKNNSDVQHYPDCDSNHSEKIGFAYNVIEKTQDIIREKISNKTIDVEFVRYWGEFQKALGILDTLSKEIEKSESIRSNPGSKNKEYVRGWYALWYDYFQRKTGKKKRKEFDNYFEKILLEIKNDTRFLPKEVKRNAIFSLIDDYSPNKKGLCNEHPLISDSFRQKKFSGKNFQKSLENAQRQIHKLPPVGEEFYPIKK